MRLILGLVLVLAVGGCTNAEWSHAIRFAHVDELFDDDDAPALSAPMPAQLNPKCREVASNRSADVLVQGYDGDVARAVFNSVYTDCFAWAQRGSNVQ